MKIVMGKSDFPMMMCGHAAQGTRQEDGKPVCVICIGIDPNAEIVDDSPPNLDGRKAICHYRFGNKGEHSEVDSSYGLAFFEHRPNEKHDMYYCGCFGWD